MGNNTDHTANLQTMKNYTQGLSILHQSQTVFDVEDIQFPLSTKGMIIVDASGKRVKLAGGNWSGSHMCRHCVDGLQCRPLEDIARHIRYKFDMNCIRLTYSLQMIFDNNVIDKKYLIANPDLVGLTALEIFDRTIEVLTKVGLMVILNNHNSSSMWCCSNDDGEGLWWTYQYPECKFFQAVKLFANRYSHNPRVIGMDLRNQLRKAHGLTSTWGDQNPKTDWKRAAKKSGQLALSIAPHWLIFVSGLNYQLDLTRIHQSPLHFSVKNKLVYSGHLYGFSWVIPSWKLYSYSAFKKKLFNEQTYVRGLGYPFLLGEFGNNTRDIFWKYMMKYLKQTGIDWTYWALDGFKCDREKDETYGVFTNDFSDARHPDMLQDLKKVGRPGSKKIQQNEKQQVQQPQIDPKQIKQISKQKEMQEGEKRQVKQNNGKQEK